MQQARSLYKTDQGLSDIALTLSVDFHILHKPYLLIFISRMDTTHGFFHILLCTTHGNCHVCFGSCPSHVFVCPLQYCIGATRGFSNFLFGYFNFLIGLVMFVLPPIVSCSPVVLLA